MPLMAKKVVEEIASALEHAKGQQIDQTNQKIVDKLVEDASKVPHSDNVTAISIIFDWSGDDVPEIPKGQGLKKQCLDQLSM